MLYVPSPESDTLLELWYHQLRTTGDLDRLYLREQQTLSFFLHSFQRPVELVVYCDATPQIIGAVWFDPSPTIGAWAGLWTSPAHRRSPTMLEFILSTYIHAFEVWPVFYGLTRHAELLVPHRHLGYTVQHIPQAYDGQDAWLVCLTKSAFEGSMSYARFKGTRRQRRQSDPRKVERTTV